MEPFVEALMQCEAAVCWMKEMEAIKREGKERQSPSCGLQYVGQESWECSRSVGGDMRLLSRFVSGTGSTFACRLHPLHHPRRRAG